MNKNARREVPVAAGNDKKGKSLSDQDATAQLVPFQYESATVRIVVIDGEPWFVLADLCKVLEIANHRNVAARLTDDQKGVRQIDTLGGQQNMTVVNESGMYEVVIRSDKAEAVTFRRWITSDVLPSIRKTGTYSTAPAVVASSPEEQMALGLLAAQKMLDAAKNRIAELEPKADLADTYLTAQGGARLVREVAKTLGMKEKDLRRFLLEEKLVFARHAPCGNIQYDHYAEFAHHFQAREIIVNHTWGTCAHYTLHILPRGVELIRKRLGQLAASA